MKKEIYRFRPSLLTETLTDQFGIEVYYNVEHFTAIFYAGKSSKSWWYNKFMTLEDMLKRIYSTIDKIIEREQEKIDKANRQREAMKKFEAKDFFKVGDIVRNSWGWEQTNIDYFQVTEVLGKKIRVSEIRAEIVEAVGSMSANVKALRDCFVNDGDSYLLSLKADVNCSNNVSTSLLYVQFFTIILIVCALQSVWVICLYWM
jgi:hypothetical protein